MSEESLRVLVALQRTQPASFTVLKSRLEISAYLYCARRTLSYALQIVSARLSDRTFE